MNEMVVVTASTAVLVVAFIAYILVAVARSKHWVGDEEAEKIEEAIGEAVWVYDPALAAPKLVEPKTVARGIDYTEPAPEPELGPPGVYNVVYWSDDRTNRREKQLWAENPQQARQLADQHEDEYVRETGAPRYSFSRIDLIRIDHPCEGANRNTAI